MYFSSRERNLIRLLMDSDQAWTVKKLAEVLGVSERTIHRDLSGVEPLWTRWSVPAEKNGGRHLTGRGSSRF